MELTMRLLAAMILWFIGDWCCNEGRREAEPRRILSLRKKALSSHLSSSQRKTCRCNVVVKCAVEILIREKWIGCSPSGWLQPCWLSVGEKTLCMKVGLYTHDGLTWNMMYCHMRTWHLWGFKLLALLDFICFFEVDIWTDDRHVFCYAAWGWLNEGA